MSYISRRAVVRGALGQNVLILGPSMIKERSYIDNNVIIGYPVRSKLIPAVRSGAASSNIIEVLDELSKGSIVEQGVVIRSGSVVYENVRIEDNVEIGHNVLIRENTVIKSGARIGSNCIIEGDVVVGANANIQSLVYISKNVIIEDDVFIGPNVVIINDKYPPSRRLGKVVIRRGAVIGANSIILPDVEIGENSVVGAGSVVTRDVKMNSVVCGVPARLMYSISEYLRRRSLWESAK